MEKWSVYIIKNNQYTYVGMSNNVHKRLRQHNKEIKGGAKYTTSKSSNWKHVCIITGFKTKQNALQFEWALKHVPPRNKGGIESRLNKLEILLNKDKWTSNSPNASDNPLYIEWINKPNTKIYTYPEYISQSNYSNNI